MSAAERAGPGRKSWFCFLAALGLGLVPMGLHASEPTPAASSKAATGALIGVAAIGVAGDLNELMSILVTRSGESYSVSAFPLGVRIEEEGWTESPRNSLTYKPYPKLLTGIGYVRAPFESAGTLEINPETGAVSTHFLTEAGHGHSSAEAEALAVSQDGRVVISVGGALLSFDIGQPFWDGATWLHDYFSGAGGISALAFSPDGVLYGWSFVHGLVRIDPGFSGYFNYFVDFVKPVGRGPGGLELSSIEFIEDGTLIGVKPDRPGQDKTTFYVIDPFTGAATPIGNVNRRILSLARPGDWQLPSYVALGDSFSSGEGGGSYLIATNRRGVNECRRSTQAWSTTIPGNQPDYRLDEAISHPLARPAFPACSGALIRDLLETRDHAGEEWSKPPGPQLASVTDDVDFVTMTIGGNDMGFGDLILWCAVLDSCDQRTFPGSNSLRAEEWAMLRIARIAGSGGASLENAYRAAAELGAAVYVLGYPDVLAAGNENCALPASYRESLLGRIFFGLVPEGYPFQNSELRMFRRLGDALNSAIECSARRAGVHPVIADVLDEFEGHELCGDRVSYFHGLSKVLHRFIPPCSGCEPSLDWKETLHPNRAGQAAYAAALQKYVRSLADPRQNPPAQFCSAAPAGPLDASSTASLPTLGGLDVSADPVPGSQCASAGAFAPGQMVHVSGLGFAASSPVALKLVPRTGVNVQSLGTATTDSSGKLLVDVPIPAGATAGMGAVLEASGKDARGEPLALLGYLAIVERSDADQDGDGIPDLCDNCHGLANTEQRDADRDLVGDSCDACPLDGENDIDGDGLCADVDPCPYVSLEDLGSEGACRVLFSDSFESGGVSAWSGAFMNH